MPILFLPSVLFLPCLSNYFEICFVQDILIIKKYVIADNYSDGHKKIPPAMEDCRNRIYANIAKH